MENDRVDCVDNNDIIIILSEELNINRHLKPNKKRLSSEVELRHRLKNGDKIKR